MQKFMFSIHLASGNAKVVMKSGEWEYLNTMEFCWQSFRFLVLMISIYVHESSSQSPNTTAVSSSCNTNETTSYISRCGTSWSDANSRCGDLCPCNTNAECSVSGETCWADMNEIPCLIEAINGTYNKLNITIPTIGSCGTESVFPLAFDDGPWTTHNASLLIAKKLNDRGISATFFVSPGASGANITADELDAKCDLIGKMLDYGHYVESHSYTHSNFAALSYSEIISEVRRSQRFIKKCARQAGYNDYESTMFRPPFGSLNVTQAKLISDLGCIIVMWNFDSLDYTNINNLTNILNNLRNNTDIWTDNNRSSISTLFHDFGVWDIIDEIIDYVENELEYEIINSNECYEICDTFDEYGICLDPNGQDWTTIIEWYEQIEYLQYIVDINNNNKNQSIYDYFTFDIPTTTIYSTTDMIDETENEDEDEDDDDNISFFDSPVDWIAANVIESIIIGISIFICCICCLIKRICEKNNLCVVDDGFDEYFKSRHGHMVSQQDVSIHSQTG